MKIRLIVTSSILCALVLSVAGCRSGNSSNEPAREDVLRANIDTTVSPAHDFAAYANGTWLKNHPIPASESRWGIGNVVHEETYARLREISENAASNTGAPAGTPLQKIGDMYFTGMDSAAIEQAGVRPIQPELDRIQAIQNRAQLLEAIAWLKTYRIGVLFDLDIYQDMKNSEKMALYVSQGGLGLPNRDYYFNTDARTENIRKEYLVHLAKMMQLLGEDEMTAKKHAGLIMTMETELAKNSRKLEDLRDPYSNYNKMSVAELNALAPSLGWKDLLVGAGIRQPDTVIVGQPEFVKVLDRAITAIPIEDWKVYLRWHVLNACADKLSSAFEQQDFAFYGMVLEGKKEQRARWKRVIDDIEGQMGELLGQLYVEKYFSPKTKKRYEDLVDNVLAVYGDRIRNLAWMTPATKEKALAKLATVTKKVGYPDRWRDYSDLTVSRESYVRNVLNARHWSYEYQLKKLGKPVERWEWDMTPQTYNAYYNPSNNEIVLPAAIFIIPGLPDSLADDAIIYAYAGGSTIGHEITHGFDDEGRQFDAKGNLTNWWTKEDEKMFTDRAAFMVKQFDGYTVLDSMHVNGKASLGENIADLAGVILGYDAFKKTGQWKSGQKIAGLTPDQRYFLAYALSWASQQRDQRLAQQIMTDVHSPAFLRINGPLANIPEFYAAFGVKPGDPMYRPDSVRVNIW